MLNFLRLANRTGPQITGRGQRRTRPIPDLLTSCSGVVQSVILLPSALVLVIVEFLMLLRSSSPPRTSQVPGRESWRHMFVRSGLFLFAFLIVIAYFACPGGVAAAPARNGHPLIATQPISQTVAVGQSATFTVTAIGHSPLTYQWQKNGVAMSGAIASTYSTPGTSSSDNGAQFTVVVRNTIGSVTSSAATLTVVAASVAPS